MNRIERVRAAIRGEAVDRVPAGFWAHFPPEFATGREMARAHLDFHRRAGTDFIKLMNDNPYQLLGIERIDRPSDWRRLRPEPADSAARSRYVDGLKEVLDSAGHEALVIVTIFNPFATANDNRTGSLDFSDLAFDGITAHLRDDPASTLAGLRVIAESLAGLAVRCIEEGAAGVFFSANGSEPDRLGEAEFARLIAATDRIVLDAARAAGAEFNLLHVCGSHQRLGAYVDYPVDVVNWAPQMANPSLAEGRALLGRTVLGGLDQCGPLASGSRALIEAEVRSVLDDAGGRGVMLGAGCALPGEVPPEAIAWACEAAANWSRSARDQEQG